MLRFLSPRKQTLASLPKQLCTRKHLLSTLVSAEDEWSPLRAVIVGRAEGSAFPSEPDRMITNTMPSQHRAEFRPSNPFPAEILARAQGELDCFADLLAGMGIQVYRPDKIDWMGVGGYTGAMPRDGLMAVGNTIIEAPFAWGCRRHEIQLAYSGILDELSKRSDSFSAKPSAPHYKNWACDPTISARSPNTRRTNTLSSGFPPFRPSTMATRVELGRQLRTSTESLGAAT